MNLSESINLWDGKSASDIEALYQSFYTQPNFIEQVVSLIADSNCQKGATWLLKHWIDEKNSLDSKFVSPIYQQLSLLDHWESKLHILQMMPHMPIDKKHKKAVESFLRTTLTDNNKFVRAWSYSGFDQLAKQHSEYIEEAEAFLAMAMKDEAPSVKARIRKITKA